PRLQASAELTLASLRYQEDRFAEQIKFARSALSYYADYGFLDAADRALILIGRGERELGDYDAALKEGLHLVEQAQKVGSAPFVAMGEELLGGVLLNTEHYPDALMHYKHALETTEAMGRDPTYQQIHYANTLWRLGRYDEAEAMLEKVSPAQRSKADIRASIVATRAEMLESRGNAKAALALLNATRATLEPSQFEGSLQQDFTVAQTMLGSWTEAKAGAAHLVAVAQSEHNPADLASGQMMLAEIDLHTGNPASALAEAEQAEEFFRGKGKEESQAVSLLLQAEAAHQLGQRGVDVALSRKSLDIFWHLQQSWGVPVFRIYATRPDRRQTMRALGNLCAANGAPCNVPS
ncbi:MAG TPA: tetratricopeptide repeat protein, partial [Acidobacteriaceae bacterium]|nr:tetratricopeptide repeat protein [Acidobacteriaceae bacterium]